MHPRPTEDRNARERAALRWTLLLVLVLAPLPFGSVQPWAVLSLKMAASALGAWGISLLLRHSGEAPRLPRWFLAVALVPAAVGSLQLLPLPRALLRVLTPRILEARESVAAIVPETACTAWTSSLSPPETLDAVLRYLACVLVGLAAAAAFTHRAHLRSGAAALAASGAFQALYGSAEYVSGHQHIFAYVKRYHLQEATGTFINRNHFAEYLVLTLPLALLLMIEGTRVRGRRGWRESLLRLGEREALLRAAGFASAALIWTGVILSYSRGGLLAALLASALFVLCAPSRRAWGLALGIVLLVPTSYLLWLEVRAPGERFFQESEEDIALLGGRLPVWKETLGIVTEAPLVGTGLGTFEAAFERRRPPNPGKRWDHAHNDWLQSLAEGGPLTVLSLLWLLVLAAVTLARPSPFTGRPSPASAALLAALGAAALHGFVDFGLRIPALAFTVAAVTGMTGAVGSLESSRRGYAPSAWRWLLLLLPSSVMALGLAVHAAQAHPASWALRPGSPWLAPPGHALRDFLDRHLMEAVSVLNDRGRAPAERLAVYRERLRSADRLLVQALAVNPAQPRALARLAAIRFELAPPLTPEDARKHSALLELASRIAPNDPQVQALLGEMLLKMGRREEALPYLRRAVGLDPEAAHRLVALLRSHLFGAEEILEDLGPSSATLVALREPYEEDGQLEAYVSVLEKTFTAPTAALLAIYGDTCRSLREPDRALANFERIGPFKEPRLEAERRRQRALTHLARGDRRPALEEARAAAALRPKDPSFLEHLGQVALTADEAADALAAFRQALSLAAGAGAPSSWRARLYREIGQAEERAGRPDRAYDAYQKCLRWDAQDEHARRRVSEMRRAAGFARQ